MSYQLVEQLHKKAITVGQLCRVLDVSCTPMLAPSSNGVSAG